MKYLPIHLIMKLILIYIYHLHLQIMILNSYYLYKLSFRLELPWNLAGISPTCFGCSNSFLFNSVRIKLASPQAAQLTISISISNFVRDTLLKIGR